jgi:hypothetical protein
MPALLTPQETMVATPPPENEAMRIEGSTVATPQKKPKRKSKGKSRHAATPVEVDHDSDVEITTNKLGPQSDFEGLPKGHLPCRRNKGQNMRLQLSVRREELPSPRSQSRRKTRKQRKLNPPLLHKNQRRILTWMPKNLTKTLSEKASPLS